MKMGPDDSYICLVPPPIDSPEPAEAEEAPEDVTPVQSWSLLQPLSGKCLYVRLHLVDMPTSTDEQLASATVVHIFLLS